MFINKFISSWLTLQRPLWFRAESNFVTQTLQQCKDYQHQTTLWQKTLKQAGISQGNELQSQNGLVSGPRTAIPHVSYIYSRPNNCRQYFVWHYAMQIFLSYELNGSATFCSEILRSNLILLSLDLRALAERNLRHWAMKRGGITKYIILKKRK